MPRKSKIVYDPSLTIEENAVKNKVSNEAIRYFIKVRGIDREGDRQAAIIAKIKEAKEANPDASKAELVRLTGLGISTITKYLPVVEGKEAIVSKRQRREAKPLVWGGDIKEPSGKGRKTMSQRLATLPDLFKDADMQDVKGLHDFIFKDPEKPMLFIGNGGMLDHFAGHLYEMNKGVARCITPLELAAISDETIRGTKCLLLSAGGGNMDIKYAAKRLLKVNADNTTCLTYSKNGEAFKDHDPSKVFHFKIPPYEEGFIAVEEKFYRDALMYRAFTGNRASDVEIGSNAYKYQLNQSAAVLTPLRRIRHFVVLYSDYGEPAAHDFESVLVETGVASVQVSDYRNYCHGRFLFVGNHTRHSTKKHTLTESDAAVVLLISPRNKGLVKDIREKALAKETPIVIIETEYNDCRAALDLIVKSNRFLADYEEKGLGINPCVPDNYNAKEIDKRIPKNGVGFEREWTKNGPLRYEMPNETKVLEAAMSAMEEEEKQNGNSLLLYPAPTIETLTRFEEYDASKYLCYAFRQREDKRKGKDWIPFGNMNSGFEFDIQGVHFHNSEAAYICGMFSDNNPKQQEVQKLLVNNTNGKTAKGDIRHHNQGIARKDWYDFNVPWMMYVVWQKVCGNKEFRDLLLAVPDGAIIIEDTTFHNVHKPVDTPIFWGARNLERKEYHKMVKKYAELTDLSPVKAPKKRKVADAFNDFTDYGVFRGSNVMGKILTICRNCYKEGIEPPIDFEALSRSNIYLLGKRLEFPQE